MYDDDIPAFLAKLIVENSRGYAIFTLDEDRQVTSWNVGAERLIGWSADEIVGQSGDLLFTPEDRHAGIPALECATAAVQGIADDVRWHLRKDGTRFWANGLLMSFEGGPAGFVKILRDQTEKKLADDERDALLGELARVNALQTELLALVSHELRTPLTTIGGTADLLIRESQQISEQQRMQALEDIRNESQRMDTLISNMLSMARSTSAGPLDMEPLLLQRELPRLAAEHARRFPARAIDVRVPADLPPVEGQQVYLAQVVRNLLENTEKYARADSTVEVEVTRQEEHAVVRIADQGEPLHGEVLDRIFAPFFRGDRDRERAPGLGLGMAVCQRLIEAQGGEIVARGRTGGGLEVEFKLRLIE